MKLKFLIKSIALISLYIGLSMNAAMAQTSTFVYQGKLQDGGNSANGNYQFEVKLFDAPAGGNQIGLTLSGIDATATNGIFAVSLDFGAGAFNGADLRFLQIGVRPGGSNQAYTVLTPRQQVTSTPYAIKALNAQTAEHAVEADNSANLGGVPAAQYVITSDPRMTDPRDPLPNSGHYIQNGTNLQSSSNFNVSGEGRAQSFSSATHYSIGGVRVLSSTLASGNIFAGPNAGNANPSGGANTFVGVNSGKVTTTGYQNAFFGFNSGQANTAGHDNSMFGNYAGAVNTTGSANAFFGAGAGVGNTGGHENAFFGMESGGNNTTGSRNTILGRWAGLSNTTENDNTFIGYKANGAAGITNATAIGANAVVTTSNTMVLGTAPVTVKVPGSLNVANTFTANVLNSGTTYQISGITILSTPGTDNIFAGAESGASSTGGFNAFFGSKSGKSNTNGFNNSFFGAYSGFSNTSGANNAFFGTNAGLGSNGNFNAFFGSNAGFTNTLGSDNSFFGNSSGLNNTTGNGNSFFGRNAGKSVEIATNNAFFGAYAGENTTTGGNAYFGGFAGQKNTTGFGNVFVGANAGKENTSGSSNTFIGVNTGQNPGALGNNNTAIGAGAKVGLNVNNATAIGANTFATQSNSVYLGTASAKVYIDGNLQVAKDATFDDLSALSVKTEHLEVGNGLFVADESEALLSFGSGIDVSGNVGAEGGNFSGGVVAHFLSFRLLAGGGSFDLCYGANGPEPLALKTLASCSSSRRYKDNIEDFKSGLSLVERLRPVTFDWKSDKRHDVGFVAEEVAEVEPLLATYNGTGQIEGVKYAQITTVLVNAIKEQQSQIEQQRDEIAELKALICAQNPEARVCQAKPADTKTGTERR